MTTFLTSLHSFLSGGATFPSPSPMDSVRLCKVQQGLSSGIIVATSQAKRCYNFAAETTSNPSDRKPIWVCCAG